MKKVIYIVFIISIMFSLAYIDYKSFFKKDFFNEFSVAKSCSQNENPGSWTCGNQPGCVCYNCCSGGANDCGPGEHWVSYGGGAGTCALDSTPTVDYYCYQKQDETFVWASSCPGCTIVNIYNGSNQSESEKINKS